MTSFCGCAKLFIICTTLVNQTIENPLMSNLRLNITDQNQTTHDTVHLFFVEALLAALTAEPETNEELGLALARFIKPPENRSPFSEFKNGTNLDTYDTGV